MVKKLLSTQTKTERANSTKKNLSSKRVSLSESKSANKSRSKSQTKINRDNSSRSSSKENKKRFGIPLSKVKRSKSRDQSHSKENGKINKSSDKLAKNKSHGDSNANTIRASNQKENQSKSKSPAFLVKISPLFTELLTINHSDKVQKRGRSLPKQTKDSSSPSKAKSNKLKSSTSRSTKSIKSSKENPHKKAEKSTEQSNKTQNQKVTGKKENEVKNQAESNFKNSDQTHQKNSKNVSESKSKSKPKQNSGSSTAKPRVDIKKLKKENISKSKKTVSTSSEKPNPKSEKKSKSVSKNNNSEKKPNKVKAKQASKAANDAQKTKNTEEKPEFPQNLEEGIRKAIEELKSRASEARIIDWFNSKYKNVNELYLKSTIESMKSQNLISFPSKGGDNKKKIDEKPASKAEKQKSGSSKSKNAKSSQAEGKAKKSNKCDSSKNKVEKKAKGKAKTEVKKESTESKKKKEKVKANSDAKDTKQTETSENKAEPVPIDTEKPIVDPNGNTNTNENVGDQQQNKDTKTHESQNMVDEGAQNDDKAKNVGGEPAVNEENLEVNKENQVTLEKSSAVKDEAGKFEKIQTEDPNPLNSIPFDSKDLINAPKSESRQTRARKSRSNSKSSARDKTEQITNLAKVSLGKIVEEFENGTESYEPDIKKHIKTNEENQNDINLHFRHEELSSENPIQQNLMVPETHAENLGTGESMQEEQNINTNIANYLNI